MSNAEGVPQALAGADSFVASGSSAALSRLPVYLACTVLALLVNYAIGKEMAWDTLNYHLYAGFSAVHDRFAQDYFAAGPQAYINPYAYVPFYALVSTGLPALLVASMLALVHSVMLWLTFELALVACPGGSPRQRLTVGVGAVAMAAVNPLLLQQIGSSFADITTGTLVLGGCVLLLRSVRSPAAARILAAACLIGAATALKPTNATHAIAAGAILMLSPWPVSTKARYCALYAVGAGVAFALVTAPWAYRLEQQFGNPFFPLLNNVFRSPYFTTEPLRHFRFIPSGLGEALWRPFAMLNPLPMVHEELRAPDPQYAALLLLAFYLGCRWVWPRRTTVGATAPEAPLVDTRALAVLGCAFTLDWVLWLSVSGNSRYFLPMACVASVLLVALIFHGLSGQPKLRNYALATLFTAQAIQLWMGTDFRWHDVPWDGDRWFEVDVPRRFASEPNLYLTLGMQSNSYIAPYLAPGAGLISFAGGYPLEANGPNGARVKALLRRFAPHVRFLARGKRLYADNERRLPSVSEVNGALSRFGLRADGNDCGTIAVRGLPPELEATYASSPRTVPEPPETTTYLVSCAVVPGPSDHSADGGDQQAADTVLDRLEDACPQLFQPRRLPTDARGNSWQRNYMNTDLIAWVSHGEVKFVDPSHGDDLVVLGKVSDWLRTPQRLVCGRRDGHYFARLVH